MSLPKIVYLLLGTYGFHVSFTSPNPTPPRKEQIGADGPVDIQTAVRTARRIAWFITLAEIKTILASVIRSSPDLTGRGMLKNAFVRALLPLSNPRIYWNSSRYIGLVLATAGMLLRYWCYRTLGKNFTFEVSVREGQQLITSGPYAIVRHPSYLGIQLSYIGVFLIHGSPGSWVRESGILRSKFLVLGIPVYIWGLIPFLCPWWRMKQEDEALKKAFKEQWEEWKARVPRAMIPFVF